MKNYFLAALACFCALHSAQAAPQKRVSTQQTKPEPAAKITLRGRVLDASGNAVANARVFHVMAWDSPASETITDSKGAFRFEISATGQKIQYVSSAVVFAPGWAIDGAKLTTDGVTEIRMQKPQSRSGLVKFASGKSAPGARVTVQSLIRRTTPKSSSSRRDFMVIYLPPALKSQLATSSDTKGKWTLENLPSDTEIIIALDDERYVPDAIQLYENPIRKHLVAKPAGRIEGKIVDASGKPAAGVAVKALAQKSKWGPFAAPVNQRATAGANGQFLISQLTPGKYHLLFGDDSGGENKNFATVAPALENVDVRANASTRIAPVKLVVPAILQGRVLDKKSGRPLASSVLFVYGPRQPRTAGTPFAVVTDEKGFYRAALVAGAQRVFAAESQSEWLGVSQEKAEAASGQSISLRAGETRTLDLRIVPGPILRGIAVDEKDAPLPNVYISVGKGDGSSRIISTDQKGRFELKGLAPQRYWVGTQNYDSDWELLKPEKEDFGSRSIAVNLPQKESLRLVLRRRQIATITGRVLDTQGQPLENVQLRFTIRIKDSWMSAKARSGTDGAFSIEHPAKHGTVSAVALRDGYRQKNGGETTRDGENVRIADIIMERLDGRVAGCVLDANAKPVIGARVVSLSDVAGAQVLTDADGKFTLQNQPTGTVEILAAWKTLAARGKFETQNDVSTHVVEIWLPVESPPSQSDEELAQQILDENIEKFSPREGRELAQRLAVKRPQAALDLALRIPQMSADDARVLVSEATLRDDENGEWASREIENIKGHEAFVSAAVALGLAQNEREAAQTWFDKARARVDAKSLDPQTAKLAAHLAALSYHWKMPESSRWLELALALRDRFPADVSTHDIARILARGGAQPVEEALQDQNAETQLGTLSSAIRIVARVEPEGAARLLRKMNDLRRELTEEKSKNWQSSYAHAAKYVIFHLGPRDAAKAAELARTVDDSWNRPAVLTLASLFGDKAQRLQFIEEAIDASTQGPYMTAELQARLAALSYEFSPETVENLFHQALEALREQSDSSNQSGRVEWAFYRATVDPAQARVELENQWRQKSDNDVLWIRSSVAQRMVAVDARRALEMANSLSLEVNFDKYVTKPQVHAKQKIAEYLLMSPLERLLVWNAGESGFAMDF
jgi:protocatechuate 3,4-dioxygenase beta subunit